MRIVLGHYIQGLHVKRVDVQDALQDGFEPGALPPIGPDGAPDLPPLRPATDPPPRLCEAGPCVHYHRFEIQMDAQRAIGDRLEEGGRIVGNAPPQPFHVHTHHYCYPDTGIEMELGGLPVLTCNRWQPMTGGDHADRERTEEQFLASARGQKYKTALDAWIARQEANQKEIDDVAVAASTIDDINMTPSEEP